MDLNHKFLSRNQVFFLKLTAYSAQSNPPWIHSYTSPSVRRISTAEAQRKVSRGEVSWSPQGSGRRSAISKSKRRNRIATRKNRREKGRRAVPSGSNPHSYGESFSWSGFIWGSQKETKARTSDSAAAIAIIVGIKFIIFPWALTKTVWLEVTYTYFNTRKIMNLISRLKCTRIVKQRLRSVSIRRLPRIRNGVQR